MSNDVICHTFHVFQDRDQVKFDNDMEIRFIIQLLENQRKLHGDLSDIKYGVQRQTCDIHEPRSLCKMSKKETGG